MESGNGENGVECSQHVPPLSQCNGSQHISHPSRTKRAWSEEEDQKLIEVLLQLHRTGKYKADRGFKPGLYAAVEKELESRMPGCGLRAYPHIYSRVKIFKSHFNIVTEMIHNTSGFGWDSTRKCVTTDDMVWASYLQKHKTKAQFRGKTFKYLDELTVLFGTDRATGSTIRGHVCAAMNATADTDYVNPEQASENNASQSVGNIGRPSQSVDYAGTSSGQKRKGHRDTDFISSMDRNADKMVEMHVAVGNKLCDAINNVYFENKGDQLLEALRGFTSLTPEQPIKIYSRLTDRPNDLRCSSAFV